MIHLRHFARRGDRQWVAAIPPAARLLGLDHNNIGDEGMKALATALLSEALPSLKSITVPVGLEKHHQLKKACQKRHIDINSVLFRSGGR